MKMCSKCGLVLPKSAFAQRSKDGATCNSYCRSCQREYYRLHYRQNSEHHNRRRMINAARQRARNRKALVELLRLHRCVDCGEGDPRVLEFDHVRGPKCGNIGDLVARPAAWDRILSEIAKCEVRCANCHRRKT